MYLPILIKQGCYAAAGWLIIIGTLSQKIEYWIAGVIALIITYLIFKFLKAIGNL